LERSIAFEFSVISCKLLVFGEEKNTREKKNYTEFAEDTEVTEKRREEKRGNPETQAHSPCLGQPAGKFSVISFEFLEKRPQEQERAAGLPPEAGGRARTRHPLQVTEERRNSALQNAAQFCAGDEELI